jgi:perosamine synthetase
LRSRSYSSPGSRQRAAPRKTIQIARPLLGEEECDAVTRVLRSGWITQGPEVAAFEREFAEYVGATHACAVSSCTAALHVALAALEIGEGDEVVTVSHSFIATVNAVRYVNARPVFVDVDAMNGNIDPSQLEKAISPATKALLVVHQIGMPCHLDRILSVAGKRNRPVVEDAACAVGSQILFNCAWENIGRPRGIIACFSFHPRKLLSTGDGGMLTTLDAKLDHRFRLLRQHGMSVSDRARHASPKIVLESYECIGFNYRMTDIQAAIGRIQLKRLPAVVATRRKQALLYHELLGKIPGLGLPQEPAWARSNWQSYVIRLPAGVDQVGFMQAMLDRGVATRRGVMCAHREAPYAGEKGRAELRNSEYLQDRGVILPLYPELTEAEQRLVVETVAACLGSAGSNTREGA